MVVQGLQTYCETTPGVVYSVNLGDIIREELSCTGKEPTVVLDTSSACKDMDIAIAYGGRPRLIREYVEKLVKNIISCGANLIVINRGNEVNLKKWFKDNTKPSTVERKICLETLKGNQNTVHMNGMKWFSCRSLTFGSIESKNYTVFTSLKNVHEEVAEIATKQNCLAVIGQDSNYLIYEGIRFFILMKSFNIQTLDCSAFDRNKLLEHLGLKSYQMPLFATLCGNDVMKPSYLFSFHQTIYKRKSSDFNAQKFLCIAEMVKHTSACPYQHVNEIVNLINKPTVNAETISASLDMYLKFPETLTPTTKLTAFANQRKRRNEWNLALYRIFTHQIYFSDEFPVLYCIKKKSMNILLRPLRKKIYGILLHDIGSPAVKEYSLEEMPNDPKKPIPNYVFPEKPQCEHPGLIQLWYDTTVKINFLKWDLFCDSLGGTLNHFILRTIPKRLLFPTVSLHYLHVQIPLISGFQFFEKQFELEAFLVVALLLEANLHEALLEKEECKDPELHVTCLAFGFNMTCYLLELLNQTCGLIIPAKECCMCHYYDGVLLHLVYRKMKEGANWKEFFDGCTSQEVMFTELLQIVLTNPD